MWWFMDGNSLWSSAVSMFYRRLKMYLFFFCLLHFVINVYFVFVSIPKKASLCLFKIVLWSLWRWTALVTNRKRKKPTAPVDPVCPETKWRHDTHRERKRPTESWCVLHTWHGPLTCEQLRLSFCRVASMLFARIIRVFLWPFFSSLLPHGLGIDRYFLFIFGNTFLWPFCIFLK